MFLAQMGVVGWLCRYEALAASSTSYARRNSTAGRRQLQRVVQPADAGEELEDLELGVHRHSDGLADTQTSRFHIHTLTASDSWCVCGAKRTMLKSWADETAADLFSRTAFPGLDLLPGLPAPGLRVGETLELCGEPSTGKTALLMEAAVRCAMPAEVGGIAIGGAESHVIVVDCDGGFDVLRLASSIRARLAAAVPDQRAVEAASRAALQRVRLMQCTTCRELLIGLCRVRAELETPASGGATLTATTRPRLLLIDGVSAFQWMERGERRHSAVDDCRADGIEARVGVLVGLLRRQRLSIAWSRCPLRTRGGGWR